MTSFIREIRERTADETGKYPHPWIGSITLSNASEKGQQLISEFVEELWSTFQATDEITASQAFGTREVKLFVSATTQELATVAIEEAVDRIKTGFRRNEEELRELNPATA